MALALGGQAGGGPTLWMSIDARDKTQKAFNSAKSGMEKLSTVALSTMRNVGSLSMQFATLGRVTGMLSDEQAKLIGVFGMVMSVVATVATVVKALTAIEWAHVAAITWKVALMTLGIGVAIAAAVAIAMLAMQTDKATEAQKGYNTELERGVTAERRRTANKQWVRRGGVDEIIS